jgi:hypothetical protein
MACSVSAAPARLEAITHNPPMAADDGIDRYFTEHIVGGAEVIDMGPADTVRSWPERGVWVSLRKHEARLLDLSMRSLWARDPTAAVAGKPIALKTLRSMRITVGAALLFGWSLLLWNMFRWLHS